MFKLLSLCFLFLPLSVIAGVKAPAILEQYEFSQKESVEVFLKFPELLVLDVASEYVAQTEDDEFTLKLYSEISNDVYVVKKSLQKESVSIEKSFVPFEINVREFSGPIQGTLFETIQKETGSEKLARQMGDAFKDDFTTTKGLIVDAHFSLSVTEYFENGRFIKFGDVQQAKLVVGRATSERVLKQDLKTLTWSLTSELSEFQKIFYAPVRSNRVSSLFQFNRRHPVKRRIQPHNGIDFVAKSGTPVYPALEGTIIAMGRTRAKGNFILIEHDNGYQTTYDHLRKFTKGLRIGDRVELNNQIGEVGRTGYATGAHLHFGVLKNDLYINPVLLLKEYTFAHRDSFETADLEEESDPETTFVLPQ